MNNGLYRGQFRPLLSRVQLENGTAHEAPPATIFAMFPLPPGVCVSQPATVPNIMHSLREPGICVREETETYDWRRYS